MTHQSLLDLGITAQTIPLDGGRVRYWPAFVAETEANMVMAELQKLNWSQDHLTIGGKTVAIPRLQAWYGEPGAHYRYSGLSLRPQAFTPTLRLLKERIEAVCTYHFNSVLANFYRDGNDSVGWHSDDEPELGSAPAIASLSFGATRRFRLKHKRQRQTCELSLGHGDLIIMEPHTQQHWYHQVPKTRQPVDSRINLTFRHIIAVP